MRHSILLLFLISAVHVHCSASGEQSDFKTTPCRADFTNYPIENGNNATAIATFLKKQIAVLQNKSCGLVKTHSSTSLAAYHYSFVQTYMGVPIFMSDTRVNVSMQNLVFAIFDNFYDVSDWAINTADFDFQKTLAYQAYIKMYFGLGYNVSSKKVIAFDQYRNEPVLCYEVTFKDGKGKSRQALVAQDRILYEQDANMYARSAVPDSTVSGLVFNPDPLTTAHVVYGGAYKDYNDSDITELNAQRQSKVFKVDFDGLNFNLQNQYLQLQDLNGDNIIPVTSSNPSFNYTRHQTGFEDVMVYYHLSTIRSYIHGMGFTIADSLLIADPHGTNLDNSYFSIPNNIYYGTGGVDDAEDADVITHEYTHFLSWNANQTNGFGATTERNGIDEGTADYTAASYSKSIDNYNWGWVYNWDGHHEFWSGRIVIDMTVYPTLPNIQGLNGPYKYGTIWVSALMDIWNDLDIGKTDSLMLQTLYAIGTNATLPQAATLFLKSDTLLFNGIHSCTIRHDFAKHGLALDCHVDIVDILAENNFVKFTVYPNGFAATPIIINTPLQIDLYDIAGQKLQRYSITSKIVPEVPAGIYVVDVSASGIHQTFKWVKVFSE